MLARTTPLLAFLVVSPWRSRSPCSSDRSAASAADHPKPDERGLHTGAMAAALSMVGLMLPRLI